ncbi:hypothetical protein BV378_09120 [Nostoc sp. RF31YmG]|nr:hypothetical protein BV378_09120 [Nostoc sp. RF31YmG]
MPTKGHNETLKQQIIETPKHSYGVLEKLAIEAQKYPSHSPQRRIAITRLINELYRQFNFNYYRRLFERYKKKFNQEAYDYEDALQDLFFYIIKNIDNYSPEKASVITWVNFICKHRFFLDKLRSAKKIELLSLQALSSGSSELFNIAHKHLVYSPSASEILRQYIEEDPEKLFENTHVKGRPEANLRRIFLSILDGKSFKDVSIDLNLPPTTIYSFYQRSLKLLKNEIRINLTSA